MVSCSDVDLCGDRLLCGAFHNPDEVLFCLKGCFVARSVLGGPSSLRITVKVAILDITAACRNRLLEAISKLFRRF